MDSDSSDSSSDSSGESETEGSSTKSKRRSFRKRFKRGSKHEKVDKDATLKGDSPSDSGKAEQMEMRKVDSAPGAFGISKLEANMPADAVLTEHGAAEVRFKI